MGFEGPPQQSNKPESVEVPTYKIAEIESQILQLEEAQKEAGQKMRDDIHGEIWPRKYTELGKSVESAQRDLGSERARISPEDEQLLATIDSDIESLNFQKKGFDESLRRYKQMQSLDEKGPRPDVDKEEYNSLQKDLIQLDGDLKDKRRKLVEKMEDPLKRGLISRSKLKTF